MPARHLEQWCHSQLNKKVVIFEHQGHLPSPEETGRGRRGQVDRGAGLSGVRPREGPHFLFVLSPFVLHTGASEVCQSLPFLFLVL